MMNFFKGNSLLQYSVWSILAAGTILTVYKPDSFLYKVGENYMVHIMMAYFSLGLLFLLLKDSKSTFVSFACCVVLCLVLRTRTPFYEPINNSTPSFSVANFNVANTDEDYEGTVAAILGSDADVISIQEVTPDWDLALRDQLKRKYPYDTTFVRIDFYGAAIYSKYPLVDLDTFHCEEIPNVMGSFRMPDSQEKVFFITSHTAPPVSLAAFDKIEKHLITVANKTKDIDYPLLTLGDYNVNPWSSEIMSFRQTASLNDSRRDNVPNGVNPFDHIFYSNQIDCAGFERVYGNSFNHIGVKGVYQLKEKVRHADGIFQ